MTKQVLLSKVKDNPYRDKKRNPVDKDRVEQLVESIGTTGFWKGVYGREVNGNVEIAFGHTRVDAAHEAGLKEIPIEIEKLTDSDMLMRMTRENLRGELLVSLEAVSAAVKALGDGTVVFNPPDPSTRKSVLRYAPSFVPGKEPKAPGAVRPYTTTTLARFLGGVYVKPNGEPQNAVDAALGILEMEERKVSGFSERTLRVAEEEGTRYLGAKKIIRIISDVKQREAKVAARTESAKKEAAEVDAKQRKLQADIREREQKEETKRKALVTQLAEAKREEDERKAREIKERIVAAEKAAADKSVIDGIRMAALEAKVEETKKREVEAKKEDAYLPIKREVERIIHKLEGYTSTTKEALSEEVKALARQPLNSTDRERLRQAALNFGAWYCEWVAMQFIPPFGAKKSLLEYRSREEAKRRAQETKDAKAAAKKEKAK